MEKNYYERMILLTFICFIVVGLLTVNNLNTVKEINKINKELVELRSNKKSIREIEKNLISINTNMNWVFNVLSKIDYTFSEKKDYKE